jgi:tRNA(fMet)-specific endonuclease VapC
VKFLLDTCLVSEAVAQRPNEGVVRWLQTVNEADTCTSVLVVGEVRRGIAKLPNGEKKDRLGAWMQNEFLVRFRNRVVDFELPDALAWGDLVARLEHAGTPRPAVDTLLAATALARGLTLVTRNEADFASTGVELLNPWR